MRKNRKRSPLATWFERVMSFLQTLLARMRPLFGRIRELARTVRTGPMPRFDSEDALERSAPAHGALAHDALVHDVEVELATEAEGADGRVSASTIVPSARWDALDRALGKGKERWRNLATAGVALLALVVAVSVLWTNGGDEPAESEWAPVGGEAARASELVPSLLFDEPADARLEDPSQPTRVAEDDAAADPLPDGVPTDIAYGGAVAAAPNDPTARPAQVAVAPPPAAPPVVVAAEPEPEPTVAEVDPDDARELARKAGCPDGTLPTEVLAGDTVQTIAWRHAGEEGRNLIPQILQANRKLKPAAMQPGDLVCVPGVERVIVAYKNETYKIRRGDTIAGLVERFGYLSRANVRALTSRARKKDMLFAGREVTLPVPQYASRL